MDDLLQNEKKLKTKEILEFLQAVNFDFPVPLEKKVDLTEYAQKIKEKATLFAIKEEMSSIRGLIAGYTNNIESNLAYIALLAVRSNERGKGLSKILLKKFLEDCQEKGIQRVHLYTTKNNVVAQNLYKRFGFVPYVLNDEMRKEDVHLICHIKE